MRGEESADAICANCIWFVFKCIGKWCCFQQEWNNRTAEHMGVQNLTNKAVLRIYETYGTVQVVKLLSLYRHGRFNST